jgi:hypothetical protein
MSLLKEEKLKETDNVSEKTTVRKMRRYIGKLTSSKYGYTYDEISEMLKGLGINLSVGRIKYLVGKLKKSREDNENIESREENRIVKSTTSRNEGGVKINNET